MTRLWVREGRGYPLRRVVGLLPLKMGARFCVRVAVAAAMAAAAGCAHDHRHPLHHEGPPAVTGNPAAHPLLPPRYGRPGRRLLRCAAPAEQGSTAWDVYASAEDFSEGKQSFFLKRTDPAGGETLYPLHGHFLDGGSSGIFMVHDGAGTKEGDQFRIDQSVNMGLIFFRTTADGVRAVIDVFAEDKAGKPDGATRSNLVEHSCGRGEGIRRLPPRAEHVRMQSNSGATPPSHWLRESDRTALTCRGNAAEGEYRFELLGSTIWPGHLGFLVARLPGTEQPIGYNVHLLADPARLLIHVHSYPHRTRERQLDTMEETETVLGGLLLVRTESGYAGWAGLASSSADPYNMSFSREATMTDYAAMGRTVVPLLPVTCAISSPAGR